MAGPAQGRAVALRGVVLRRRMWMLLQVHAKQCQRSDCPVPRCKELREMRRRAVVRQEDQRRVAYKNMVRMPGCLRAV